MRAGRLRSLVTLGPGEVAPVAWGAASFFAILGGYFLLRPVRDALVLDGDPAFIKWLFTATFIAMTAVAAPWGALVARRPRGQLAPIVFRACAVQLLGFAALIHAEVAPLVVAKVFYVWLSVMNLFVVSVFWSVCADLADPATGRRWFGAIAAGGTAGALVGPLVTRSLAHELAPAGLLLIAAATLEIAVWTTGRLIAATPNARATSPRGLGGHALAGLAAVARSRHLAGIAGYALIAATLATFVYLRQAELAKAALPDRATRTAFFADVELATGLATLAIQLFATSRLMRWLGVGVVLALLPAVQGAAMLGLTLAPSLAMAVAASASGRAATHALARPARELLFTAVAREDKYKAKNVIDTLIYRFGDFGSAWLHAGLLALGVAVVGAALPLAGAAVALAIVLGRQHRARVAAAPPEP
ncbi:MAG: MFS transporter [Kofleriaceae bacterium]|jgi:AAA family ATP:ADP antiporter|nr:MFS transporter [Kofleriaceae bacterium]MBP9857555.1 MFS transporter [Kofleriaceae bacterium]